MRSRVNGGLIGSYQTPNSSLTSTNRSAGEAALLTTGGVWPGGTIANPNLPPTITSVVITDSNYNALDDTAVNTAGGYMRILGTNFAQNPQLYFNGTLIANSWVSSSEVRVQLPANSAGTGITFMLFNTTTSGGTIYTTGRTYSGVPSVTNSTPITLTATAISVQFVGSGDSPFVFSSTNAPSGTTLSSSGLLTGTLAEGTYSFTVTVDDAQLQTTTQSYSLTVSLADVYWNTVGLSVVPNPTITGNTFIADYSLNNADLTVFGDTKASPYTPYQTGYYSNYFDGSGDYLSIANTANHDFGTGDFTVEFWLYAISMPNTAGIVGKKTGDATNGWQIYHNTSVANGKITARLSQGLDFSSSTSFTLNTWEYWAVTRSGTTVRWFRNGVLDNTGTNSANLSDSTTTNIGYSQTWGGYYTGYISNLRVVKGTALYTATYTSSTTPLVAVSGTQLLTCQSNRLIDNSLNNFAITKNGDTSVIPAHPFASRYDYGTPYYSTYFDGSGDYLSITTTSALALGSGNFTVECWIYPTSVAIAQNIICDWRTSNNNQPVWYLVNAQVYWRVNQTQLITAGTIVANTWTHLAMVKNSTTLTLYVNGVSTATSSDSVTYATDATFQIGKAWSADYWNGYISNLRIVKGQALYTANFTPSTSPLTTTSQGATAGNVSLLTCQDATLIDNSTNAFAITSSGDARPLPVSPFTTTTYSAVSTVLPTYGSAYFDGTGDYLTTPSNTAFLPSGDFTIELWVYIAAAPASYYRLVTSGTNGSASTNWGLSINSSRQISFYTQINTTSTTSTVTITVGQWNHVAVSRSGSTMFLFANGIGNSFTNSGNLNNGVTTVLAIGADSPGTDGNFLGYISNLRLVNGTALYKANFYPGPTPLTAVTNTQLLTLQYNGSSNTSQIRDASNLQNLITRAGNSNQGTFAPFRTPGHWSVFVNGTKGNTLSDQISVAYDAKLSLGANNFCMEVWFYPLSLPYNNIFRRAGDSTNVGEFGLDLDTSGNFPWTYSTSGTLPAASGTQTVGITANSWYHIAAYRISGNLYLAVNGTVYLLNSALGSSALNSTSTYPWWLGSSPGFQSANYSYSHGYYSNWRMVIGSSVYTASNFTPPTTPLRWITNTKLLTCQDGAFVDNGGNNFTITRTNSPSIRPTSPFTIGTYTPTSYSVYFDGTGDYLSITSGTTTTIPSGNDAYTMEAWVYATALGSASSMMGWGAYGTTSAVNAIKLTNSNTIINYWWGNDLTSSVVTGLLNAWNHIAATFDGTTRRIFYNGALVGSDTPTGHNVTTVNNVTIGTANSTEYFTGYISNARIVKGQALYIAAFTPSTTPLTTTSQGATAVNVSLLTCQGTSVTDNSSNAFAVTANGNAVPARHNPFGQTDTTAATAWTPATNGSSVYFDGTGDYLTAPSNPAFAMGTGSFTWEAWVYPINYSAWRQIFSTRTTNSSVTTSGSLATTLTTGVFTWYTNTFIINASTAPALNSWSHVAVVRNGTAMAIYHNGVNVGTATNSDNLTLQVFTIGANNDGTEPWLGYISNVRVTKGTALYTNSFVPSVTPVTSTAATALLMDSNPSVTDWSMNNNLETVGDAKLAIQTPYAGSYYSNYFDGTGDYLTVANNAALQLVTATAFTIESWIYIRTLVAGDQGIISKRQSGNEWQVNIHPSFGYLNFWNAATTYQSNITLAAGQWYHIAVTWDVTTLRFFVNGTMGSTYTGFTVSSSTNQVNIGCILSDGSNPFNGYISNLRVVKGQALYTTTFTPSTTPLTTTSQGATASNVSLLTCQSRTFIDNSPNAFSITRNGDTAVKVQNPFSRVTDYSVYFDGTGDAAVIPFSPNIHVLQGDFTIELWFYSTSTSANQALIGQWNQTLGSSGYLLLAGSSTLTFYLGSYSEGTALITGSSTYVLAVWNHVAIVRSGSTFTLYQNGVSIGTATNSSTRSPLTTVPTAMGNYYASGGTLGATSANYYTGYITEVRISKYARYTGTFNLNTTSDQFKVR